VFHERPNGSRSVLVISSVMRQDTADLNLETPTEFDAKREKKRLIARLEDCRDVSFGASIMRANQTFVGIAFESTGLSIP